MNIAMNEFVKVSRNNILSEISKMYFANRLDTSNDEDGLHPFNLQNLANKFWFVDGVFGFKEE